MRWLTNLPRQSTHLFYLHTRSMLESKCNPKLNLADEHINRSSVVCLNMVMIPDQTLVLASGSPRRQELLQLVGWSFRVLPANVDETRLPGELPHTYVARVAEMKARSVAATLGTRDLVLAADTIVVDGEEILGKPLDVWDAVYTLRRLRGRLHRVFTALALLRVEDDILFTDLCQTSVPMREYSEDEIQTYVSSGDAFDKAGSYAIQHAGFQPVDSLAGCYANVVGLPLCHLTRTMARMGLTPPVNVPAACQKHLSYTCPVYHQVLQGEK